MSLLSSLRARAERRRGFHEMMKLDDHLLRDIGISRSEIRSLQAGKIRAHRDA